MGVYITGNKIRVQRSHLSSITGTDCTPLAKFLSQTLGWEDTHLCEFH